MPARPSAHDLVVADATLRHPEGRRRIGVDNGRISALTQQALTGREEVDAAVTLRQVLNRPEGPAYVMASGRLVASPTSTTMFHQPSTHDREHA